MGATTNKTQVLAANVADGATLTVTYPAGVVQADLVGSTSGVIVDKSTQAVYRQGAGGFTAVFGASNVTVTNDSDVTWAAGAELIISFGDTTKGGSYNADVRVSGIADLTAATGTASATIADVGGSFTQATLNNNFKSLADSQNAILAALREAGILNG